MVQRTAEIVVLRVNATGSDGRTDLRLLQDTGEVEPLGFPVAERLHGIDKFRMAHHVVDRAETEFGHDLPKLFGHEAEEVNDIFRFTGKLAAQLGILRCDAHRAGVEMAEAQHDAAQGHQRPGGKSEFLGAEQAGNGNVATGKQLPVDLDPDAAAQVVEHQCLLGFGQAEFPW